MIDKFLVSVYLLAIVLANLSVVKFGPSVVIINAFLFIGLDLTVRDLLHEKWKTNLWLRMGILIASGSLLSWFLNKNSDQIATASFLAFAGAGISDAFMYWALKNNSRFLKINGSNVISSIVDSGLFLVIAFGWPLLWVIMLGQVAAKITGGFVWFLVLRRFYAKN